MDILKKTIIVIHTILLGTDIFARDIVLLRHKGEWTREYSLITIRLY